MSLGFVSSFFLHEPNELVKLAEYNRIEYNVY